MSITKTIGGDRLGAGKKMQAHLHNYYRSTHNLSEKFASSLNCGILYPCMYKLCTRGDSFDISIDADARTIPTVGPLFGSFKMQVDVFQVPLRLYQGILHNNPLAIGLKASRILFPTLTLTSLVTDGYKGGEMNNTSLLKYLGMSGIGRSSQKQTGNTITREIQAIKEIAYYDIYKNYYANKQEENGYLISATENAEEAEFLNWEIWMSGNHSIESAGNTYQNDLLAGQDAIIRLYFKDLEELKKSIGNQQIIEFSESIEEVVQYTTAYSLNDLYLQRAIGETSNRIKIYWEDNFITIIYKNIYASKSVLEVTTEELETIEFQKVNTIKAIEFPLENIDNCRYDLLSNNRLGDVVNIPSDINYLPYNVLTKRFTNGKSYNTAPLNGLALKTYQNDIFNNWLNTEWIEGENSVNEMSKVAVVDGAFSMDALNFAQKLYNMLNRVAISGNTYEDYQDVVWEEVKRRQIESPIFVGGLSQEIMFDEIVQNAPTEINGDKQPLGTLGGRGRLIGGSKKGGKLHVKCDEACYIMAIVSLTPRIFYTQGNDFDNTEIKTFDDLHKPAMDGIGFQDLIGERLAWWDTVITANGSTILNRSKVGKLPAWIEYMTSYDRAFGDFAEDGGRGYMILNRNYEHDPETGGILDATTYIDPTKYNYAFANAKLDAQNFWVEIYFNITKRWLGSARMIPNV